MIATTGSEKRKRDVKYSLSFTTGSLLQHESVKVAALYLELGEWNAVRDKVIAENLLQSRTLNTLKRLCSEIISRLKRMSKEELLLLVEGNLQERGYLLWMAVCRRYRFIADFAIEVLHERYITLKPDLTHDHYDSFFNQKAEWHSEVEKIRPATRSKLRQILFKMLREADLLSAAYIINPVIISPRVWRVLSESSSKNILYFPISDSEFREARP